MYSLIFKNHERRETKNFVKCLYTGRDEIRGNKIEARLILVCLFYKCDLRELCKYFK